MRSAVRTVAVALPALVVVAVAWLRLEQPASLWRAIALLALALGAAALPGRWLRVAGAVVATVAAARIAVGVDLVPWRLTDPGSGFGVTDSLSSLGTRYGNGFSDFYGTHLPFDPRVHVAMDALVLSGVFTFALAVALLVAARKPVWGALALLVGAGWPATLLGPSHGVAMGAAILGAALVVLAGLGSRRVTALALPAAAVVALGAVAVGSATAARHGLVHWQSWNLAHVAGGKSGVNFVWDAQYGGIDWPKHPSVVLQVESAHAPSYLRAAVLDDFRGDAWAVGLPRAADSLEPPVARDPRNQTAQTVTVVGFADQRLVGGSIPVRFSAGSARLDEPEPGFASLGEDPPPGFRYTVWSYTARPTATELAHSAPAYPSRLAADGLLAVGDGVTLPPFGTPHRFATVRALVGHDPGLRNYLPLANLAEDVTGGSRTPYEAVSRLEDWFASTGGFSYSNHPTVVNPPLVGFVTQTQTGYCQYFAGAMALMLRYLGIPARVAVGFAGGQYSSHKHAWLITDREAHAWVEVWFNGYGWLPFDPTPAVPGAAPRQTLAGANRGGTIAAGPSAPFPNVPANPIGAPADKAQDAHRLGIKGPHSHAISTTGDANSGEGGSDRSRPVLILLLILAGAGASIASAKAGIRMIRRARRDPRRVAAACREELASFLVDQRIEVPRSATLAELGELVHRDFGVRPEPFVAAATSARFGPAERAGAAAHVARRELRDLLGGVRRSLTRRERLRGLFSLRSLTRPARPVDASASLGSGMVGSTGS